MTLLQTHKNKNGSVEAMMLSCNEVTKKYKSALIAHRGLAQKKKLTQLGGSVSKEPENDQSSDLKGEWTKLKQFIILDLYLKPHHSLAVPTAEKVLTPSIPPILMTRRHADPIEEMLWSFPFDGLFQLVYFSKVGCNKHGEPFRPYIITP